LTSFKDHDGMTYYVKGLHQDRKEH
jgi:hypothetical protein